MYCSALIPCIAEKGVALGTAAGVAVVDSVDLVTGLAYMSLTLEIIFSKSVTSYRLVYMSIGMHVLIILATASLP